MTIVRVSRETRIRYGDDGPSRNRKEGTGKEEAERIL